MYPQLHEYKAQNYKKYPMAQTFLIQKNLNNLVFSEETHIFASGITLKVQILCLVES